MTEQTYESAGVQGQGDALSSIVKHLGPTLSFAREADTITRFGDYASVLKLNDEIGLAVSTDGVGTKTIVASRMDRYDTIGFDCVAMNVNDVLCVGARPIALVDYLGVNRLDPERIDQILRGLAAAAEEARIAIPGGELAQLPEVIGSDGSGPGDETAFDLVGTCVGVVHPQRVVLGETIAPRDDIVAVGSSGIHSNGLTLARRVLLENAGLALEDTPEPFEGTSVGDELLRPTRIYVRAVDALNEVGVNMKGAAHITSDGLTNLSRLRSAVGYRFERLPDVPPIFDLISDLGDVPPEEMFRVFNMGTGFVVIVEEGAGESAAAAIRDAGYDAIVAGVVTERSGEVELLPFGLTGGLREGESSFSAS